MRLLSLFALLSLSVSAVAAVKERTPAQMRRELARHGCDIDGTERLPFPLPSFDESEEWGDADHEAWASAMWTRFCDASPKAHACRCESLRSGGAY